jgi:hypothetical protein
MLNQPSYPSSLKHVRPDISTTLSSKIAFEVIMYAESNELHPAREALPRQKLRPWLLKENEVCKECQGTKADVCTR